MESMGKFIDAGEIYAEAAQLFESKFTLNLNAGFAFKKGNDCERAERMYVLAMRHSMDQHQTDPNQSKLALFHNMCTNYERWLALSPGNKRIMEVMVALNTMVNNAGWDIDSKLSSNSVLKDEFTIKTNALNRINKIMTACGDVESFREAITSCLKHRDFKIDVSGYQSQAEYKAQNKRLSKTQVRKDNHSAIYKCENCRIMVHKKEQCPCGTVTYCSEACQRAHWKIHKLTCTTVCKKK